MKIVFMGSPDFAVPSLKILHESRHEIVGVVTVPDQKKGRGRKLGETPVKRCALDLDLPLFQPDNLKSDDFRQHLLSWNADCFIVVGFRILPESVFTLPELGTVNLHASLLPQYRGAAPIQWAIMNGEKQTGVTTFYIQKRVDTGDILFQEKTPIYPDDTAGTLHDRLATMGAKLILKTADEIEAGQVTASHQHGKATSAPKITRDICQIQWHRNAEEIVNQIRGLSPCPSAFTSLEGKRLKIYHARISDKNTHAYDSGTIIDLDAHAITVATGDFAVLLDEVQLEGKRKMRCDEFLRGCTLHVGSLLQ